MDQEEIVEPESYDDPFEYCVAVYDNEDSAYLNFVEALSL